MFNRALAPTSGNKVKAFADPQWEEIWEQLIQLTTRTLMLKKLSGTDHNSAGISDITNRLAGHVVSKPRGTPLGIHSKKFLKSDQQRLDAAYLISNLSGYYGCDAIDARRALQSQATKNALAHCQALVSIYHTYLRVRCGGDKEVAPVCFETFITLVESVAEGNAELSTCKSCDSTYVWPVSAHAIQNCPVCSVFNTSRSFMPLQSHRLVASIC